MLESPPIANLQTVSGHAIRTDAGHWKVELTNKTILNVSDEKKELLLKVLGLKYDKFDNNNEL